MTGPADPGADPAAGAAISVQIMTAVLVAMADPAVYFDSWAHGNLHDYPTIYEADDRERVYIRAGEALRLVERAYLAGWAQARDLALKNLETCL